MLTEYKPINPIAKFTDKYGEEQVIHNPKGKGLRVFKGAGTPTLKMNRAAAALIGERVKQRRKALGMTQKELCVTAGFEDVNPKQRIYAIENATRGQGVRIGTLYALAYALQCDVSDLMPPLSDILRLSNIGEKTQRKLG